MNNQNSNKYISLKTASELYGYTRDHLGLVIRQRKLKGIKLGSYYVTTGEWMADYVKNFADINHPTLKNKLSNKFLAGALSLKKEKEKAPKYDTDNSLKEILLEEFAKYSGASDVKTAAPEPASESPYVILPIRKMENIEREKVLEKVS